MILNLLGSVTTTRCCARSKHVTLAPWRSTLLWKLTGRVGAGRLGRRRYHDLSLGPGFAVDDRDRDAAWRLCRRRWLQRCCCGRFGCIVWSRGLRYRNHLRRFLRDAQIRWRSRHGLIARTVFGDHGPQHKPRRYLVGSCPSGAVRSFIVMGDPVPDQPATRESRRRAYHGIPCGRRSAGGARRAFASPRTKRGGLMAAPPHCSLCAPSISWEPPLSDSAGKRRCWLFRATGQAPS